MKHAMVWFIAAFIAAALAPLGAAQAYSIEALMGNNPGYSQTYSYTVTTVGPNGQPQGPVVRYGSTPQYANRPIPQPAAALAQQQVTPQAAYRQPVRQAAKHSQRRSSYKASPKRKSVPSASAKRALPAGAQSYTGRPHVQVARQYYPSYPPQAYPADQSGYYRAPQTTYYGNPYQNQYAGASNYYQENWYSNGWGSSLQGCAPGRS